MSSSGRDFLPAAFDYAFGIGRDHFLMQQLHGTGSTSAYFQCRCLNLTTMRTQPTQEGILSVAGTYVMYLHKWAILRCFLQAYN